MIVTKSSCFNPASPQIPPNMAYNIKAWEVEAIMTAAKSDRCLGNLSAIYNLQQRARFP